MTTDTLLRGGQMPFTADELTANAVPRNAPQTVRAPVNTAKKYLLQRRRAVSSRHQGPLQEYGERIAHDPVAAAQATTESVMSDYFAQFRMDSAESIKRHDRSVASIEGNERMMYSDVQKAIANLPPPILPAWTEEREVRFIRVYGNPRGNQSQWNVELDSLKTPTMTVTRKLRRVEMTRTPWDLRVVEILAHPEQDGSFAECVPLASGGETAAPVDPNMPRRGEGFVAGPAHSEEHRLAQEEAARKICPHCTQFYENIDQHLERAHEDFREPTPVPSSGPIIQQDEQDEQSTDEDPD